MDNFTDEDMYDADSDMITPYYSIDNIIPNSYITQDIIFNSYIYTYINNIVYNFILTDEQCDRIAEYLSSFR